MRPELAALNDALPELDWLRITDRKSGAIKLTPLDAQPETRNLRRLKKAVQARWGQVPLIDMVTEAALRTGMLGHLTAVGSREAPCRRIESSRPWVSTICCFRGWCPPPSRLTIESSSC